MLLDAIQMMQEHAESSRSGGFLVVTDEGGRAIGSVTDGDVRRAIARGTGLDGSVRDVMRRDPISFPSGTPLAEILRRLPGELAARGRRARYLVDQVVLVDEAGCPVDVIDLHQVLEQRLAIHRHVGVLGLGYVGVTMALVLAESGFRVTGADTNPAVVEELRHRRSHVHERGLPELLDRYVDHGFTPTTELPDDVDVFVIAVSTPVSATGADGAFEPDLTMVRSALDAVGGRLNEGGLVVLRSTVPLGTTTQIAGPLLAERSGLSPGTEFHLAFAPERTVEGNALAELRALPQIIGGISEDSVEATAALFREVSPVVVRVSSPEVAELAKLVNNSYRDLSFAFANEVARLAGAAGVDIVEAISAANHGYPRNRVPLPSPGVGGPCLTKDPYILAATFPAEMRSESLSAVGRRVNEAMPRHVADIVREALLRTRDDIAGASVLICGLAFKGEPETGDLRDSPSLEVAAILGQDGVHVRGHDPVADPADVANSGIEPVDLPEGARDVEAVLVLTNHRDYRDLSLEPLATVAAPHAVLFDGWDLYRDSEILSAGFSARIGYGVYAESSAVPARMSGLAGARIVDLGAM